MVCTQCDKPVAKFYCPDMDARLKKVAFMPNGMVAFNWCRNCDRHYARCKCETPDLFIVIGGQELVPISRAGKTSKP